MENEKFKKYLEKTGEIGQISGVNESIISVSGLPSVKTKEMVITEDGEPGMVYEVKKDLAEVLMFDLKRVSGGKRVARSGEFFKIPVSRELLGRVVNPLCLPLDGEGPIGGKKERKKIEREAPGITRRVEVNRPMETGVTAVDLMVPVGYGQREVVVGDAKTGKTTLLLQAMTNQARKGTICVYVGIGKETSALKAVESYLKKMNVFEKLVMMVSASNDFPTVHYLAPLSGITVAEYFRDMGNDVLIVFDDLSNHAKAYRELSLLLKNPPGREAYPGDIFHLHAGVIERAGNIKGPDGKEVSITALPVAETLENDISGFIQTNLLSMTDGHIFFDINKQKKGQNPAINISFSVSRAGNQTRAMLDKDIAGKIRERLVQYRKVLEVTQFGAELSEKNRRVLDFGRKIETIFEQDTDRIISRIEQLFLFGLLFSGFWKDVPRQAMEKEIDIVLSLLKKGEVITFEELEERINRMENAEELKDFCEGIGLRMEKFV